MHGATGEPNPRRQRLTLRAQTGKGRQERGVDIDHSVSPCLDKSSVQHAHEPGQADELDLLVAKHSFGTRCEAPPVAIRDDGAGNAGRLRQRQSGGRGAVADDRDDLRGIGSIGADGQQGRDQGVAGTRARGVEPTRAAARTICEQLVASAAWGIAGPRYLVDEAGMTAIDPEFERHYRTWIGFTRLIKYAIALIVVILVGMAIFLL